MVTHGWVRSMMRSLRFRLVVLVVLALAPAFLLQLFNRTSDRAAEGRWVRLDALRVAQLLCSNLANYIEGARKQVETVAALPQARSGDYAACNAILKHLVPEDAEFVNLGIIGADGRWKSTATVYATPPNPSEQQWFRETLVKKQFTIGGFHLDPQSKTPLLPFATPILNANGHPQAVAVVSLRLAALEQMLQNADLPAKAERMILDQRGVVIGRIPNGGKWLGHDVSRTPLVQAIFSQKTGVTEATGIDQMERIYSFTTISTDPENTMYAVIGIQKEDAFGPLDLALHRSLFSLAIGAIVAVIAAWLGGNAFVLRQIRALADAARKLAAGDLKARTAAPRGITEINQLGQTFNDMARQLEAREAERDEALAALRTSEDQQRALSAHLQTVREEESRRIARELHDELGQVLAALKIELENLHSSKPNDAETEQRIATLGKLANETIARVRKLCTELRPGILDELGAVAALQWLAEDFENRTGVPCTFLCRDPQLVIPMPRATALFRICQEALTNVMRHAEASSVTIELTSADGELRLLIRDDGHGFDSIVATPIHSFGILGMRERAALAGGHFYLNSTPSEGTVVSVSFPQNVMSPENRDFSIPYLDAMSESKETAQ